MLQLTPRRSQIYHYILTHGSASSGQIKAYLDTLFNYSVSRMTIGRDLDFLVDSGHLFKEGAGRSTTYIPTAKSPLFFDFDPDSYFQTDMDHRKIHDRFNPHILDDLTVIFSDAELAYLHTLTARYRQNRSRLSVDQQKREIERLTIELSWKSSQIEGNTYTLLDTEALIHYNRIAPNTTKEEAVMILNHKKALDYCLSSPEDYRTITFRKIEDIHRLLVSDMGIHTGLRSGGVRITGTNYLPLDNAHQIQEALEKLVLVINTQKDVFHKALTSILFISYIQPFMDGNKRTSRLLGNALLHADQACPLSYRSIDPVDYKKAMLLFYEQHSLKYFKDLFISQYRFSVENYFVLGA